MRFVSNSVASHSKLFSSNVHTTKKTKKVTSDWDVNCLIGEEEEEAVCTNRHECNNQGFIRVYSMVQHCATETKQPPRRRNQMNKRNGGVTTVFTDSSNFAITERLLLASHVNLGNAGPPKLRTVNKLTEESFLLYELVAHFL